MSSARLRDEGLLGRCGCHPRGRMPYKARQGRCTNRVGRWCRPPKKAYGLLACWSAGLLACAPRLHERAGVSVASGEGVDASADFVLCEISL